MKMLNFGSLNLDIVYHVDHIVTAGETLLSDSREPFCGGKGLNQSIAAARAGIPVYHAGRIGKDGGALLDILREAGVSTEYVRVSDVDATGTALIQVDRNGQNCILLHSGANHTIDAGLIDTVLASFGEGDILLMQNEINGVGRIMQKACDRGMRIAFNPSPYQREIADYPLACVRWMILNEIEGQALTGRTDPEEIADVLLRRYPDSAVVLTLGSRGVYYRDARICARHGVYKVRTVDTTGAGDTFTGYFLAGVWEGLDIPETLRRASVASSLAVSRKGAAASIPAIGEVLRANLAPADET